MSARFAVFLVVALAAGGLTAWFALEKFGVDPLASSGRKLKPKLKSSPYESRHSDETPPQQQAVQSAPQKDSGTLEPQISEVPKPPEGDRKKLKRRSFRIAAESMVMQVHREGSEKSREVSSSAEAAVTLAEDETLRVGDSVVLTFTDIHGGFVDVREFAAGGSDPIRLRSVVTWHDETRTVFTAAGLAALPDGETVFIEFRVKGTPLAGSSCQTQAGQFSSTFEVPHSIHSGRFQVQLSWNKPLGRTLESRVTEYPDRLSSRRSVYLGRKSLEKKQDKQISKFYRAVVKEAQAARDAALAMAYQLRDQKEGRFEKRFVQDRGRVGVFTKSIYNRRLKVIIMGKKLKLERWKEFMNEELPARWEKRFGLDKIPYPQKHPDLTKNLNGLFEELSNVLWLEARLLAEPENEGYVRDRNHSIRWINRFMKAIQAEVDLSISK